MQTEEVFVDFGIGQVVAGDVAQRAQSLENVIRVGIFSDFVGHALLVVEETLLVVEGGQVAVDHLGVITNPNLNTRKISMKTQHLPQSSQSMIVSTVSFRLTTTN